MTINDRYLEKIKNLYGKQFEDAEPPPDGYLYRIGDLVRGKKQVDSWDIKDVMFLVVGFSDAKHGAKHYKYHLHAVSVGAEGKTWNVPEEAISPYLVLPKDGAEHLWI